MLSGYIQINSMPSKRAILDAAPEGAEILWDENNPKEIVFILPHPPSIRDIIQIVNLLHPDQIDIDSNNTRLELTWF